MFAEFHNTWHSDYHLLMCISLAETVHAQELENVLRVGTRIAGAMAK